MPLPSKPICCTVDSFSKPIADFSGFLPGTLVIGEKTAREGSCYEIAGELIPVLVDETRAYALNVTTICNALDKQNSDPRRDHLIFHRERIAGVKLFKIPELAGRDIFTCTGVLDEYDEFISYYKRKQLSGLEFDEIWSEG